MSKQAIVDTLGEEIYDIFVEETQEIKDSLTELFPVWKEARDEIKVLSEIRRGFHTLKGSGRMAGALALGEFAWAHENMLNKVLAGEIVASEQFVALLAFGIERVKQNIQYFVEHCEPDQWVTDDVARVNTFLAGEEVIIPTLGDTISVTEQEEVIAAHTVEVTTADALSDIKVIEADENSTPSMDEWPDYLSGLTASERLDVHVVRRVSDVSIEKPIAELDAIPEPEKEAVTEAEATILDPDLEFFTEPTTKLDAIPEPEKETVSQPDATAILDPDLEFFTEPNSTPTTSPSEPEVAPIAPPKAEVTSKSYASSKLEMKTDLAANSMVKLEVKSEPEPNFWPVEEDESETQLILQLFWEELPERLQALDEHMGVLQQSPNNIDALQGIERELHTLKGGARMARLNDIADVAHESESVLCATNSGRGADLSEQQLQVLQSQIDHINLLVEKHGYQAEPNEAVDNAEQVVKVANTTPTIATTADPIQDNQLNKGLDNIPTITEQPFGLAPSIEKTPRTGYDSLLERIITENEDKLASLKLTQEEENDSHKPSVQDELHSANNIQDSVRLPTAFLDKVIEQSSANNIQQSRVRERLNSISLDVGELGRTVSRLRQLLRSLELETEAKVHAGYRELQAQGVRGDFDPLEMDEYSELQRLSRALAESMNDLINIEGDLTDQLRRSDQSLTESLQSGRKIYQNLLSTRLIALNILTPRLNRVVRQTALELKKKVALTIIGEDNEIDRHLLQKLTAPLEHLLRNAIAHGIETEQQREQAGKPAQGEIALTITRDDAEIVIRVTDDGAGLNRQALRARAIEKGLLQADAVIDHDKLDRLILQPGFTTANSVSQISGRGVGMDVVFSEIKALGGSLHILSEEGKGATFELRVPFSMASNPVLFVMAQNQTYGLPMGCIQGLVRLTGSEVKQKLNHATEILIFDGEEYPLRYLGQALKLRGLHGIEDDAMFPVMFTKVNRLMRAWVVDSIVGRQDVVMQSLGSLFKGCSLYSAATITPDGHVVLLPDMHELMRSALPAVTKPSGQGVLMKRANDQPRVMIVDDSITVRKVTEKLLTSESFAVHMAKDGMEALEQIREFKPDIMLLDIEMPRMDGFELLKHLRGTEDWQHLPVIMISSRTAEKHRSHATSLGASDFLGKPYQNQDLLKKIRSQLEGVTL